MFANPSEIAGKKRAKTSHQKWTARDVYVWTGVEYYEWKISQFTVKISNNNDGLI